MEGEEGIAIMDRQMNFTNGLEPQEHVYVLPFHTSIISLYSSSQEAISYHFLIIQLLAVKVEVI